jgi:hypothetical protein
VKASADIDGQLGVTERSVWAILDDEGKASVRAATKVLRSAVEEESPKRTRTLASSHKQSVTRTGYGYKGQLKRHPRAWYGRIVERGRKAGRGRTGRRVGAARANPFVERAAARVEPQAESLLAAGADRAADRIEQQVVR